jgi:hypothetical protein
VIGGHDAAPTDQPEPEKIQQHSGPLLKDLVGVVNTVVAANVSGADTLVVHVAIPAVRLLQHPGYGDFRAPGGDHELVIHPERGHEVAVGLSVFGSL